MATKKAKAKEKTAEAENEKTGEAAEQECDFDQARKKIANKVVGASEKIADAVIEVALKGQLAPAKYLFEAVGLYPPTEETEETAKRPENSLAYVLLKRMGLPTEPVVVEEDPEPRAPRAMKIKDEDEDAGMSGGGVTEDAGK
jgi:hypothetical protein